MLELTKIRVGISAGDPNGIGFEIILKTFQDEQIYDFFIPIVFAHPQNLIDEQKNLGLSINICSLKDLNKPNDCLLYTSPSPRDGLLSRMPSSA